MPATITAFSSSSTPATRTSTIKFAGKSPKEHQSSEFKPQEAPSCLAWAALTTLTIRPLRLVRQRWARTITTVRSVVRHAGSIAGVLAGRAMRRVDVHASLTRGRALGVPTSPVGARCHIDRPTCFPLALLGENCWGVHQMGLWI